jgi:glutamate formiminotransferase/formiminotetrahydrofolate cyclodeaminase
MKKRIIECVPNFSEGRDMKIINQITDRIRSVRGVQLLNVDPGRDANRTVVTFAGGPDEVCEAAFLAVKEASVLIDMTKHHGTHPRMGATDVCPLIPVSGITMNETVTYARKLAERIGNELQIPVYCYENAAYDDKRRNLANCRAGEYEGLGRKIADPSWRPDFGPASFNPRSGATAVGARNFLIAFNVNLDTKSVREAREIAFDIREKGRMRREGDTDPGIIVKDESGQKVMIPGSLKCVKAIGWYIEEYGFAQVSMNLTDISVTRLHTAFEEVRRLADARGIRVTGSELVGMVPIGAMLDAGRYFLEKEGRQADIPDEELVNAAVRSLGLSEIKEFRPDQKIIEYVMSEKDKKRLIDLNLNSFLEITAAGSPLPGGGSVLSYVGALGVALGTMTANLSGQKRGWDDRREGYLVLAEKGKKIQERLLNCVDEDTDTYDKIIEAYALPKNSHEERLIRRNAIQKAFKNATIIQYTVMETAIEGLGFLREIVEKGIPNAVADAAAGAVVLGACIRGAFLNIRVNLRDMDDKEFSGELMGKGKEILIKAIADEDSIVKLAESRTGV